MFLFIGVRARPLPHSHLADTLSQSPSPVFFPLHSIQSTIMFVGVSSGLLVCVAGVQVGCAVHPLS